MVDKVILSTKFKKRLWVVCVAPVEIVYVTFGSMVIGFIESLRNIRDTWREAT